jgi:ABC-type transport system substrate-binding protein
MLKARRTVVIYCGLAALALANLSCRKSEEGRRTSPVNRLVISKSAGPRTFNRLLSADEQTNSIGDCLMGRLIRINRQTQQPEAELASSWQVSPDGKTLTCELRRDAKFSDGSPFTSDDVVFTFQVLNDPAVASPASFDFDGQPMKVEQLDGHKIRFVFPAPYAAAERLFDGVPILPKHILEPAYREGKFAQAWTLSTPPEQIVGLGPFKLKEHVAGQRVSLARNEHYWKTDSEGRRLPYLDELVFNIDPDRSTQLLKFQQGETDLLSPVNADDVAALAPLERQGKIKITDLGAGLIREIFWFNLNGGKQKNGKPFVDPVKLDWFKDPRFRQAVSYAIDRDAIAKLVFSGKASPQYGFLSSIKEKIKMKIKMLIGAAAMVAFMTALVFAQHGHGGGRSSSMHVGERSSSMRGGEDVHRHRGGEREKDDFEIRKERRKEDLDDLNEDKKDLNEDRKDRLKRMKEMRKEDLDDLNEDKEDLKGDRKAKSKTMKEMRK